jgi:predicted dehydrogenase
MPERYRVAVIGRTGRGNYGHGLDTAWLDEPRTEIVAVSDDDKVGLAAAAKRCGVEKTYLDYRKMLDETKPDIVSICSRWIDKHFEMAMEAAERGMHVYMEKPFVRTLVEADKLVEACQMRHVRLGVGHPTQYSPRLQTIKQLIADGKIGQLLELRGRGKEDRRGGGEDLWVLGTHVMDMLVSIGGKPSWCSSEILQEGRPITKDDVYEGNEGLGPLAGDHVRAMYGMPNGVTAYFASTRNANSNPSRYGLQIFGSRGVIELLEGTQPSVKFLGDGSWSPGRSGAEWQDVSSAGIGKPEPLIGKAYQARHLLAIKDLLAAIEDNREPLDGPEQCRAGLEMIMAVFESQRQGGRVMMPLENREHPLRML